MIRARVFTHPTDCFTRLNNKCAGPLFFAVKWHTQILQMGIYSNEWSLLLKRYAATVIVIEYMGFSFQKIS